MATLVLYGETLKVAGLSHFLSNFGHLKKQLLALKIEPLNQSQRNFEFGKLKEFLIRGKKNNAIQKYLGC